MKMATTMETSTTLKNTTMAMTIAPSTTIDTDYNYFRNVAESDLRSNLTIGLVSIVFISIILAILLGNTVVIIAVLTYRQLKKQVSNLFILNLAFADLSVVLTVMIWSTMAFILDMGRDEEHPWIFTNVMCYFQCAMNYCLIVVSMMTLGFISIDRLIHIIYPLRYVEIMTVKRIRIMICWTWIQGLIIGFIPVGMQWIHYDYCEVVCAIDWSEKHADKFVIVAFITCFIAPFITMIICYSIIFKRSMAYTADIKRRSLASMSESSQKSNKNTINSQYDKTGSLKKNSHKHQTYGVQERANKYALENNNADLTTHEAPPPRNRRHNKTVKESTIIKSLLVVVLVFFICMTPFSTTKLIKVLKGYIPCWVNTLATIIQLLSSACNPLIYGIFRKEYRKAFKIQYNKLCHRMQARFTSSEYSDSFSTPYYTDSKPATLKRKEVTKKMSISTVKTNLQAEGQSNNNSNVQSNVRLCSHTEKGGSMEGSTNSNASLCDHSTQRAGAPILNPEKKYSLPQRTVSFNDSPDLINQTTEIVAL